MVIGQLCGNLLGGAMSQWVGLENVFCISKLNIYWYGANLFTKDQKFTEEKVIS